MTKKTLAFGVWSGFLPGGPARNSPAVHPAPVGSRGNKYMCSRVAKKENNTSFVWSWCMIYQATLGWFEESM